MTTIFHTGTMHQSSLVGRLMRVALIWAIPVLIFAALALTLFYRASSYRLFDEQLESTITILVASVETSPSEPTRLRISRRPAEPRYQQSLSGKYWIVGSLGSDQTVRVLSRSRSMAGETIKIMPDTLAELMANPGNFVKFRADGPDENDMLRVVGQLVYFEDLSDPVVLLAAALSAPADNDVRQFGFLSLGLMLLLTGGMVIAVFMQVRVGLAPLFDLRNRVVDVREGRMSHVDGIYPSEIAPLATELNTLIDHNRNVVDRAKTHVSNLAHALKTPLAVIVNEAESSKGELAKVVRKQSDIMRKQVDHHLRRARAAARGQVIGVSTPVTDTVTPLARTLERIYRDKDIDFTLNIDDNLFFRGEKTDLEEMVGNLMDNACKWTEARINIAARTDGDDETYMNVSVSDDGPGLTEDEYAQALMRGARLDEAKPGTGFGLAIVDDLAKAYKGELTMGRSDMGGLLVTLRLPRRVEPSEV